MWSTVIERQLLENMYLVHGLSMMQISKDLECSPNRVVYWMDKYAIKRRTISEAIYQKSNPDGDPFTVKLVQTKYQAELLGMGLGLYWGEGTKANKYSVRLGNTDPQLLIMFMKFLIELFEVDKKRLRFGLQIFTDIDPTEALNYWSSQLDVETTQFYKIHVTPSGSIGTYRKKSKYGVVTLYFHNKKLRDIIVGMLPR